MSLEVVSVAGPAVSRQTLHTAAGEENKKKSKMGSVKLKVKSASASIDDLELDCDLDWTVLKVKSEISTKYPGHPSPQVSSTWNL